MNEGRTDNADGVWLVFVIRQGETEWHAAYDTRQEAIDHINRVRPGGMDTDPDGEDIRAPIEFAYVVQSPYFVSLV